MTVFYYTDLDVWQKSMDLSVDVYKAVKKLPKEELFGLSDQMRRAVISIPSNIAEGQQRNSTREFLHFLYVAKGSLAELETQIKLCEKLEYFEKPDANKLLYDCAQTGRMLNGLINRLNMKLNEKQQSDRKGGENPTTDH